MVRFNRDYEKYICKSDTLPNLCDEYTIDPFYFLWITVENNDQVFDTIKLSTLEGWPPIKTVPYPSLFLLCNLSLSEIFKAHKYVIGFTITNFSINGALFWLTIQIDGINCIWANNYKTAYGTNRNSGDENAPEIWYRFRNQTLHEKPDINFGASFSLNIIPLSIFELLKIKCIYPIYTSAVKTATTRMWQNLSKYKAPLEGISIYQLYIKMDF